ncbi:tripartite tricarboxylate transporter substrate binding protein [Bradyrhizobium diazoefficiens]|uniref:Bug family tripartite tricarboxylate transporter substrate binding protein n=1 Tax=Bradyrhizobium diazoefficiens TaxID=1355477 RepID=UPI00190B8044|nr:tripartite tricarboxylate transporter substrate binding protein [Bradyrhizobium diazoefficiens]MBK3666501.1 tripartite tricarboxylate transporter substrate binding protein [Bradyrhizobium diazoefficiens]
MTMARGLTRRASLGLLGALATPWLARAQSDYPNRVIKLIVPYAAGGSSDVVARFIAERMRERLGQAIIIENRPGAGAIIGSQFVAKSVSDGYTLLLGGVSTHAVNPHLRKPVPYDGISDFTSLGLIGTGPLVVSVNPSVPVHSLQELIAYGKANPTKLAYGSATGVILHLAGELLKNIAGFEMLHVPYGGNGPALTDVLGGRLQVMVDAIGNSAPYIADGKLRPLVVPSQQRTPLLPDVPSSAEAGLPNYQVETWFALYGPAAMSDEAVAKINTALNAVLLEPDGVAQFAKIGLEPRATSPAQAAALLEAESEKWGEVIRRVGLQVE